MTVTDPSRRPRPVRPRSGVPATWIESAPPWVALTWMLAVTPGLQIFASNQGRIFVSEIAPVTAGATGIVLVCWLLARALPVSPRRLGAFGMGAILVLFSPFYAIYFGDFLEHAGLGGANPYGIGALLCFGLVLAQLFLALLSKTPRLLLSLTAGVTLWVFLSTSLEVTLKEARLRSRPFATREIPAPTQQPSQPPDVFHILLDAMPSPALQRELFAMDPLPTSADLEARGFRSAPRLRSQYPFTVASMASMLNLDRIPRDAGVRAGAPDNSRPLKSMIDQAAVWRVFRQAGYEIAVVTSGGPGFETMPADLRRVARPSMVEHNLLTKSLPGLMNTPRQFRWRQESVAGAFEELEVLSRRPGPLFVFCHVLAPHAPAILHEDGALRAVEASYRLSPVPDLPLAESRRRMTEQIRWVAGRAMASIDAILARPGRRAAIFLHGDHGPNEFYGGDSPELRCRSAFETFYAELLPDVPPEAAPVDRGLVNTYVPILEHWFGVSLEPRPTDSRFSTWEEPYRYQDCPGPPEED